MTSEVTITVSGPVGSGKSAMCKEIEILCRALGVRCEWEGGQQERNISGGDSHDELAMYAPTVKIVEALAQPAGSGGVAVEVGGEAPVTADDALRDLRWMHSFLNGDASMSGSWFGDDNATGRYWWRAELTKVVNNVALFLAAAPASPQGWMPIESAPRDGARVLLAMGGIAVIGKWDDAYANEVTSVTHWQPLPAPPTTGGV